MTTIAILTIIGYLTAALLLWLSGSQTDAPSRYRLPAFSTASLAMIANAVLIYQNAYLEHVMGLNMSVFNALSAIFWLSSLITLITSLRSPVENILLVLLPLTAVSVLLAQFFPDHSLVVHARNPALDAHIFISLVAYALITLGAVQALMLAWQHRALHDRHPSGLVSRLPPMESVEQLMFRFITVGFILLTLALATGFLFVDNIFAQHLVHKTVLSVISWVIFFGLLMGRHFAGWRGKTAVYWTLAGFSALILAYFGTKIALEWVFHVR
ncbi:cytochrome C assembly family protein [Halothiobacillus sp.]|uniref:cytochrome C assembly family protein n=1 Tax=Halothiobacillus sp. TaxID=1891311 RepID=UPI002AD3FF6E|nr:cytochrome c biogenesis protein CcsA [Halothiobacillus sp.]